MSKFAKCVCLINSLLRRHQSYLLSVLCCIFHEVNFSDFAHLQVFEIVACNGELLISPYSRWPMLALSTGLVRKESPRKLVSLGREGSNSAQIRENGYSKMKQTGEACTRLRTPACTRLRTAACTTFLGGLPNQRA